jgi:hypothetical protein
MMTGKAIAFLLMLLIWATATTPPDARSTGDFPPARTCEDDDPDHVDDTGRNVAADAHEFSLKILAAVEARDIEALFGLVEGELRNGPRRRFIRNKSFSEIFPDEWRRRVLDREPRCRRMGARGYMLGQGLIWFDNRNGTWTILGFNGATKEAVSSDPWHHDSAMLSGECFTTMWLSGDNYEAYGEQFTGIRDFYETPGQYFGGPVPLEPIVPSWGGKLYLAVKLSECVAEPEAGSASIKDDWVSMKSCKRIGYDPPPEQADSYCHEVKYSVVKRIALKHCTMLAPYLADHCLDLALVGHVEMNGGSMGAITYYSIYGIVKNRVDGAAYVVPLMLFESRSEALNYVEDLQ